MHIPVEILSTEQPKARKQYCCIWCGEIIEQGEVYTKHNGVFDGTFGVTRFHPECDDACRRDRSMDEDNEILTGEADRGLTIAETETKHFHAKEKS